MTTSPTATTFDANDLDARIREAHAALQASDRQLKAAETRVEGLREQQRQRRLDLGHLLLEAKACTPHGQWELFLHMVGIDSQRASEYMRIARYQDARETESPTSPDAGDLSAPTLARAGIDKRPRQQSGPVPTLHLVEPDRATADDARRQLRKAATWMVEGGHDPQLLAVHLASLTQWSAHADDDRRSVASDLADELRALADALEALP